MFMSYEDWLRYNNIPLSKKEDKIPRMLYRDRWLIHIMPAIVIVVAIIFFFIVIKKLLGK